MMVIFKHWLTSSPKCDSCFSCAGLRWPRNSAGTWVLLRGAVYMGGPAGALKACGKLRQWECLPFSFPGSQMGRWDHCMLLQTPSTSVPVMVSTILSPVGGQSPTVWFPSPPLSSASQGLTPQELRPALLFVGAEALPLAAEPLTGSSQGHLPTGTCVMG